MQTMTQEEKRALWRDKKYGERLEDLAVDRAIAEAERDCGRSIGEIFAPRPLVGVRCSHCGAPLADRYAGKAYVGACCR